MGLKIQKGLIVMKFKFFSIKDLHHSYPQALYLIGILSLVISGALWGSVGVPVRVSYSYGMTAVTLATLRATFATIIMVVVSLSRGRKDALIVKRRESIPCLISGFFGVAVCTTASAFAMGRIPIGLTFLLINTAPLWVIVLAGVFWKERVTWFQLLALMVGIWGVWVAVEGVKLQAYNLLGFLGALGSGLGYAVYVLNGRHGMGKTDPFKAYVQMFIWGACCLWIFAILTGDINNMFVRDWQAWVSVIYLTLFPAMAAYGILILALRFIPGGVAAIVSMTEIPFSMLWSWLFLSEIPSSCALKGGSLIVIAVVLLSLETTLSPGTITGFFKTGNKS